LQFLQVRLQNKFPVPVDQEPRSGRVRGRRCVPVLCVGNYQFGFRIEMKFASANPSCKRCVASSAVTPYTSRRRRISVMIVCAVIGSSPAVGESYSTIGGWLISALAIDTRRLIPRTIPRATAQARALAPRIATLPARAARFFLGNAVFAQPVCHVLRDRHRIKQRPFLKHKTNLPAKRQ